jgi:hypothetical protein
MFGNWIFTATFLSLPSDGARIAVCTCPIEAAANGIRSNDVKCDDQDGPRDVVRTCWWDD